MHLDKYETLSDDGERALCRAWCLGDDGTRESVLVVLHAAERPSRQTLDRLNHELGLKDELDSAWAARPRELMRDGDRAVLVLEDLDAEPLDRFVGRPMESVQFLRVAIPLVVALRKAHERGLIHKDIKPANVLVDVAGGRAWLTGFAIASRLAREHRLPEPPEVIAGTLAYMAPEQTGRMNRSVDSRSDLYALGVTFYELLTGGLPFTASDPIELIHRHLTREPVSPRDRVRGVPAQLSRIVLKLLAKTAEERYQTAAGVEADLRRCLAAWEATSGIDEFPLGTQDAADRLIIPETLYGREGEIAALLQAFDRVVTHGRAELVLVAGYSGIGKSSVVNELHKAIVLPRGIFISGKFDLRLKGIPYSTLAQAFQGLIRQILSGREENIRRWRDAIREAVGNQGRLLTDLIPELVRLIGPQEPVSALSPAETRLRFQLVFQRFVSVFARPEHPLVIFVDDLQWLDPATLTLIEYLIAHRDTKHLLLIGAYRDNEVGADHPLASALEGVRQTDTPVSELRLGPLSTDDINRFLCDALRREPEEVRPLALLVHRKTGGNAFFAVQFLTSLVEERLIRFDQDKRSWTWNLDSISGGGSTDNLLDLMIARLRRLPEATQESLKLLACLGNQADFSTLTVVQGGSEDRARLASAVITASATMHSSFRAAVEAGVIISQEGKYRFLHDRVQESAYALIPTKSRAEVHLRIGRLLAAKTPREKITDNIFDIVNQLNQALPLISDLVERARVAEFNLQAGKKAKASSAYAAACHYLTAGVDVLAEAAWQSRYELTLELYLERAECEILSSNLDVASALIAELLRRGRSKTDRTEACRLRMLLELKRGDYAPAVRTALECLRMFNLDLPEHPTPQQVQAEYDQVRRDLDGRSIATLVDLPLMVDPEMRAVMKLFSALGEVAYHADSELFQMITCCMVKLTLRHGTTEFSTIAYASLGIVLGPVFDSFKDGEGFSRLAVALCERHGFTAPKAGVYFLMQMAVVWTRPIEHALACLDAAAKSARETGEMVYACYTRQHRLTDLMARGDPLDEIWHESVSALDFVRKYKFGQVVILSIQYFVQCLRGQSSNVRRIDGVALEARVLRSGVAVVACFHWILQLQWHFLVGDPETALEFAGRAKPLLWSVRHNFQSVDYCFYHSLVLAAVIPTAAPERQTELRDAFASNLRSLQRWAASCGESFAQKYELVAAEAARLDARALEAMQLYEQAIRSASANGFIQDEAIACEVAARFYAAQGFDRIADTYLRQARAGYLRWGAEAKVKQLDRLHPRLQQEMPIGNSTGMIAVPVEHLDLATVIKVSQAVSSEIVLGKLLDTLMRSAIEQAGAERGLLLLPRGADLRIATEARTDGDAVVVQVHDEAVTAATLPESVLHRVLRTRETVILDEASTQNPFSADPYVRHHQARSVLCVPLISQAKLIGVLYLENNLSSRTFVPARIAVLKLLASQAAISLENARLYRDLEEREAKIRRLVDSNIIGIFMWDFEGRILEANEAFLRIVGLVNEDLAAGRIRWTDLTPGEWRNRDNQSIQEHKLTRTLQPFEKEYFRKDGSRVRVLIGGATFEESEYQGVAFVLDLTERKRAEERLSVQHTVAQILAEAVTVDEAAPTILRAMGECLGWDVGALWRVDPTAEALRCVELWHKTSIQVPEFERVSRESTFALGLGLPGRVWSSCQPAYVHDVVSDENFPRGHIAKQEGLHAAFGFPIVLGGEVLGVIEFFSREIRQPDQELLNVLATIGSQIGQFIERKRAEMALRDSEEGLRRREKELRDILDTIPAMTVTVLPDGTDVFIGKRFVEYSGLSAHKARRSGWKATAHPDDVDEHVSKWRSSLVSGEPIEIETRFRNADGEYRWFLARAAPLRDDEGNILNWYEVLTDIEDRKRAEMALRDSEEALRRSEAYLAEAQQLSKTGSVACNETANLHWSDETYRILGFDPLDGLPSHEAVLQRVHPDDRERFHDVTSRGALGNMDYKIEFRIIFPGEIIKYVELAAHPKFSADGEFVEYVGTIIDVTERKRAQDEHERLGQLEADLAHMNRLSMMGELSASLAHEIKQPIAAARNNARAAMNFLDMQPPDLGEVREALDCVVGDADRAGNIVDRVRDQIKKAPARVERFDLNEAIKEVVVLARGVVTKNAVSNQIGIAEGGLFVEGDRVQLQQVLLNLILNAVEAMGSVEDGPRDLSISTEQTESGVLVAVRDSGPGIGAKHLERVFDAFYTTKAGGLGMGLSICRSIIGAHGGRLWAEANEHGGAIFQFTLPGAEASSEFTSSSSPK